MSEVILIMSVLLNLVFGLFILVNYYSKREKIVKDKELQLEKLRQDAAIFRNRVNLLVQWLEKRNQNRTIGAYLKEKGIKNVGIYGLGTIGERLLEELLADKDITVSYILDKKWVLQGGRCEGIPVISPDLIKKYPGVQWLIVTPVFDLYSIRTEIFKIDPHTEIKGIDEIINRM